MTEFSSGNELEHIQENSVAPVGKLCTNMEAPAGLVTFSHHEANKEETREVHTQRVGKELGSLCACSAGMRSTHCQVGNSAQGTVFKATTVVS